MHQQSSMLNFIPRRRLTLQSLVTSKVFVNVTIGMGDFVHSSNAMALLVSLGLISCFILIIWFSTARTVQAECNRARSNCRGAARFRGFRPQRYKFLLLAGATSAILRTGLVELPGEIDQERATGGVVNRQFADAVDDGVGLVGVEEVNAAHIKS